MKYEINKAHALHKRVRFWAAPDVPNAWNQLMHLKADYVNTDHINKLAEFFKNRGRTIQPFNRRAIKDNYLTQY